MSISSHEDDDATAVKTGWLSSRGVFTKRCRLIDFHVASYLLLFLCIFGTCQCVDQMSQHLVVNLDASRRNSLWKSVRLSNYFGVTDALLGTRRKFTTPIELLEL